MNGGGADPADPLDHLTEEAARWQTFYADRSRPCPFFVSSPDENLVEWMTGGLIERGRALDIGCGNARNSIYLARQGYEVDALDVSASAVQWAREEVSRAGLGVMLHCASIFEVELPNAGYDLVYDSGCFHHIEPRRRSDYVERVARALRPGGSFGLVCFTPEGGSGLSDDDVYRLGSLGGGLGYDEQRLREIWSTDFDIQVLRRMHEQPAGGDRFGKRFLWTMLATRR